MSQVNDEINSSVVDVRVRHGGELGVMPLENALREARSRGQDLVMMAPRVTPPICEVMDMSQYVYNEELKSHVAIFPFPNAMRNSISHAGTVNWQLGDWPFTLSPEHLKACFGSERQTLPAQAVASLQLPDISKRVLADIGLPTRTFYFALDFSSTGMPGLSQYVEWRREVERRAFEVTCRRLGRTPGLWRYYQASHPFDLTQYYRIGITEGGGELCVQQFTSAVVITDVAGFKGYEPLSIVNSDLARFAQFVALFDNATNGQRPDFPSLRSTLATLDPHAMVDLDSGFWPTLLEEMENGVI